MCAYSRAKAKSFNKTLYSTCDDESYELFFPIGCGFSFFLGSTVLSSLSSFYFSFLSIAFYSYFFLWGWSRWMGIMGFFLHKWHTRRFLFFCRFSTFGKSLFLYTESLRALRHFFFFSSSVLYGREVDTGRGALETS